MNKKPIQPPSEDNDGPFQCIFEAISDGLIIQDSKTHRIVESNLAAAAMHGYSCEEFVGLHLTEYIHSESRRLFNASTRALQPGDVFESSEIHIHRDGSLFSVEVSTTVFTYQSRRCLLSDIRDVSKRVQLEKTLSAQIEERRREQEALLAISHTLASTLEFQPGLILGQLRQILEYTQGGLFALEDFALVTLALCGTPKFEKLTPIRMQLNTPETLAVLFNGHRPIRIADVWSDDPQAQFLRSLLEDETAVLLKGMHSWMWVPLAVRGRLIGGLGLAETTKDYFTAHHAALALSVANQIAFTMINTELYGQAQALAVLEERQSLARNLHDAVNQSLFSAGLIAEVLPRVWDRDPDLARQSLEDLRRLTRGAQAEMRALLAELRPSTLTDSSLGDLLRLLGNALSGRINLPVTVTVKGNYVLPAEVQIAFYRICQEALFNVAKHAKAKQVDIDLDKEGAVIELCIRDDGQGFDPQQSFPGHYGLSMMRERAEAAGVQLSVTSQPGKGTELIIRWKKAPRLKETL